MLFLLFLIPAVAEIEPTQYLENHYKGRTFILRGFYAGDRLEYYPTGQIINPPSGNDWTVTGVVQVKRLRLSGPILRIDARRLHLAYRDGLFQELHDVDQHGNPDKDEQKNRHLVIEADLGSPTVAAAESLLSQIFLTQRDSLADLVPSYWRTCISTATTPLGNRQLSLCHFSDEFYSIPGVLFIPRQNTDPAQQEPDQTQSPSRTVYRVGSGVAPPKPLNHPAAEFSNEARRAKYSGTVTLGFVVDRTGQVRDIKILKPIGMGLDQKAVETAMKYRFDPATKDGQSVAVTIALEVDFHLY